MSKIKQLYETVYKFENATDFHSYLRNRVLARVVTPHVARGQHLLDVGCNDGSVMHFFKGLGCEVSGIDISEVALARARELGLADVRQGSVEEPLPWPADVFDIVFWGDNVEHLYEPLFTLKEIQRVLKPGGMLWLSTPNAGYWKARLYALIKGRPMRTEGHSNPPWAWEHIRFFNQASLDLFLVAGGFEPAAHYGVAESGLGQGWATLAPGLFASTLLVAARKKK
ncbi:MAG: methyltransferase domain-containing protein [Kiritimatiellia bacterium]